MPLHHGSSLLISVECACVEHYPLSVLLMDQAQEISASDHNPRFLRSQAIYNYKLKIVHYCLNMECTSLMYYCKYINKFVLVLPKEWCKRWGCRGWMRTTKILICRKSRQNPWKSGTNGAQRSLISKNGAQCLQKNTWRLFVGGHTKKTSSWTLREKLCRQKTQKNFLRKFGEFGKKSSAPSKICLLLHLRAEVSSWIINMFSLDYFQGHLST